MRATCSASSGEVITIRALPSDRCCAMSLTSRQLWLSSADLPWPRRSRGRTKTLRPELLPNGLLLHVGIQRNVTPPRSHGIVEFAQIGSPLFRHPGDSRRTERVHHGDDLIFRLSVVWNGN